MTRQAAIVVAVVSLAWAWLLPWWRPDAPFPEHMLRHMTLVAVAAPALVLAAPRLARRFAPPVLAGAVVEFVVVWGWHLPQAHAAAQLDALPFALEQGMFLAAGVLVWAGALAAREPLAGAGGLLLTSMHMTLLGALLVLAPQDLYAAICGRGDDLGGQQLGGLLMLAIGTPVYLVGGLILVARSLSERVA
jgi:putative membrane protein